MNKLLGKKEEKDEQFESLIQNFKEECKDKYEPPALAKEISLNPGEKVKNTLVEMGESSVEQMIRLLECEDPYLQAGAAEVLGEIGNKKAVTHLIKALTSSKYTLATYLTAWALVKIGGITESSRDLVVDRFISAVEAGIFTSLNIRQKAIWALGEIRSHKAYEYLSQLYLKCLSALRTSDPEMFLLTYVEKALEKHNPDFFKGGIRQ